MIKTKEDLLNTYVKNPCEALEALYLTTCEGFGIKWRLGQQPTELQGYYRRFGVDKKTNSLCVDVEGTELTLADFLPEVEVVAESEVKPTHTKEDLKMTFIRNEGAVAKKWVGIVGCEWVASFQNSYYLCLDKNGRATFMPKYSALARSCSAEWLANEGYRELTLGDFEPEEVAEPEVKPTHTKESLTGIKVRINGREQWDRMKGLCEGVGLKHATWDSCNFDSNTTAFMCGHEGKFLATGHWEDTEETSEEFANLREVQYEDLFVVEEKEQEEVMTTGRYKYTTIEIESIFDWKTQLDNRELFYSSEYLPINSEWTLINLLVEDKHEIYAREEVKWQKEVLSCLDGMGTMQLSNFIVNRPEDFLEAARIALKSTGELS